MGSPHSSVSEIRDLVRRTTTKGQQHRPPDPLTINSVLALAGEGEEVVILSLERGAAVGGTIISPETPLDFLATGGPDSFAFYVVPK